MMFTNLIFSFRFSEEVGQNMKLIMLCMKNKNNPAKKVHT